MDSQKNEPYKTELINDLPADSIISVYHTGSDFYDLCRGPHVENTKFLRGKTYIKSKFYITQPRVRTKPVHGVLYYAEQTKTLQTENVSIHRVHFIIM